MTPVSLLALTIRLTHRVVTEDGDEFTIASSLLLRHPARVSKLALYLI
jgi:hypothetical protein